MEIIALGLGGSFTSFEGWRAGFGFVLMGSACTRFETRNAIFGLDAQCVLFTEKG